MYDPINPFAIKVGDVLFDMHDEGRRTYRHHCAIQGSYEVRLSRIPTSGGSDFILRALRGMLGDDARYTNKHLVVVTEPFHDAITNTISFVVAYSYDDRAYGQGTLTIALPMLITQQELAAAACGS